MGSGSTKGKILALGLTIVSCFYFVFFLQFHCCGVDTYYDWFNHTNTTKNTLPVSCCKIETGTLGNFTCDVNSNSLYKQGCLQIFSDYIKGHAATVEGVGLGLAIIQVRQNQTVYFFIQ